MDDKTIKRGKPNNLNAQSSSLASVFESRKLRHDNENLKLVLQKEKKKEEKEEKEVLKQEVALWDGLEAPYNSLNTLCKGICELSQQIAKDHNTLEFGKSVSVRLYSVNLYKLLKDFQSTYLRSTFEEWNPLETWYPLKGKVWSIRKWLSGYLNSLKLPVGMPSTLRSEINNHLNAIETACDSYVEGMSKRTTKEITPSFAQLLYKFNCEFDSVTQRLQWLRGEISSTDYNKLKKTEEAIKAFDKDKEKLLSKIKAFQKHFFKNVLKGALKERLELYQDIFYREVRPNQELQRKVEKFRGYPFQVYPYERKVERQLQKHVSTVRNNFFRKAIRNVGPSTGLPIENPGGMLLVIQDTILREMNERFDRTLNTGYQEYKSSEEDEKRDSLLEWNSGEVKEFCRKISELRDRAALLPKYVQYNLGIAFNVSTKEGWLQPGFGYKELKEALFVKCEEEKTLDNAPERSQRMPNLSGTKEQSENPDEDSDEEMVEGMNMTALAEAFAILGKLNELEEQIKVFQSHFLREVFEITNTKDIPTGNSEYMLAVMGKLINEANKVNKEREGLLNNKWDAIVNFRKRIAQMNKELCNLPKTVQQNVQSGRDKYIKKPDQNSVQRGVQAVLNNRRALLNQEDEVKQDVQPVLDRPEVLDQENVVEPPLPVQEVSVLPEIPDQENQENQLEKNIQEEKLPVSVEPEVPDNVGPVLQEANQKGLEALEKLNEDIGKLNKDIQGFWGDFFGDVFKMTDAGDIPPGNAVSRLAVIKDLIDFELSTSVWWFVNKQRKVLLNSKKGAIVAFRERISTIKEEASTFQQDVQRPLNNAFKAPVDMAFLRSQFFLVWLRESFKLARRWVWREVAIVIAMGGLFGVLAFFNLPLVSVGSVLAFGMGGAFLLGINAFVGILLGVCFVAIAVGVFGSFPPKFGYSTPYEDSSIIEVQQLMNVQSIDQANEGLTIPTGDNIQSPNVSLPDVEPPLNVGNNTTDNMEVLEQGIQNDL